MDRSNVLVSIVIPVYNAERYLECCIESVVKQTYKNIEILLLNDGSRDNSGHICQKWSKTDSRVKYFEHENMRQGPTETKGLYLASGDYITFVDSDDWIDESYVALTLEKIISERADICECCWYKYDEKTKRIIAVMANIKNDVEDAYRYRYPHFWGRLYKKEFLLSNQVCLPPYPHQDLATYPLIALLAKKICYVDQVLYFYRINTEANVTAKVKGKFFYDKVFAYLYEQLGRRNLLNKAENIIGDIVFTHLRGKLRDSKRLGQEEYEYVKKQSEILLNKYCPDWKSKYRNKYWVWGSYNSSRIVENVMFDYDRMDENNHFYWMSSIISLMSESVDGSQVQFHNKLRTQAIQRDFNKEFRKGDILDGDYLVIDFLEERFDIFQLSESTYLTYSELLEEINGLSGRRISRKSGECRKLWKSSCDRFVEYLNKTIKNDHVILIEMYLNSKSINYKGDINFIDVSDINDILKEYYEYFRSKMDGIFVINIPENLCYTDEGFEYGNFPYYFSGIAYYEIAKKLQNLF